ncbi:MAG: hypothetical protein AAGG11_15520 [Pseudomonadota bacterium]
MIIALTIALVTLALIAAAGVIYLLLRARNSTHWFFPYLRDLRRQRRQQAAFAAATPPPTRHIMLCICDHFEPYWRNTDDTLADERVTRWCEGFPAMAQEFTDADGRHPQHTFFYPEDEYRYEHVERIAGLCNRGFGEIELHAHHEDTDVEVYRARMMAFVERMHSEHGVFPVHPETGKPAWAFVHGDWALCNSRGDGTGCGIDAELPLLKEMGCVVDYTLPSAPCDAQTRKINSIYYANDIPGQSKSHDTGIDVVAGRPGSGDMLLVQGPLGWNLKRRKWGLVPRLENGELTGMHPGDPQRVDLWVKTGVSVVGRPEWTFIKLHTHGTVERDEDALLGDTMRRMHQHLADQYNDGSRFALHYVTAREMYNIIRAAEQGKSGNPGEYRDFELPSPVYHERQELPLSAARQQ